MRLESLPVPPLLQLVPVASLAASAFAPRATGWLLARTVSRQQDRQSKSQAPSDSFRRDRPARGSLADGAARHAEDLGRLICVDEAVATDREGSQLGAQHVGDGPAQFLLDFRRGQRGAE